MRVDGNAGFSGAAQKWHDMKRAEKVRNFVVRLGATWLIELPNIGSIVVAIDERGMPEAAILPESAAKICNLT